jgi:hypothetical protein
VIGEDHVRAEDIRLEELLLDPNNYRLQDEEGFRPTAGDRYHLSQVQRATFQKLRETGLKELHDSIIANGYLPIERIVVTPYGHSDEGPRYLVIEGNRRVAALKQIREEQGGGIELPKQVAATLEAVPCLVVEQEGQDQYFRETLMGIRHVGGIKQWGGYQRAKLIADLRDGHGLQATEVGAKLGLSTREVNRRYRAFKALQQMREDPEFGDYAEPALYPLFHEAVEVAEVREWMGWNPEANAFTHAEPRAQFYALITPSQTDDGAEVQPKLKSYGDVRQLKNILPNVDARRYLLDRERSFLDALTVGNRDELSRKWRNELTEAAASLEGIGALEVRSLSTDDVGLLRRLIAAATEIINLHEAVTRN